MSWSDDIRCLHCDGRLPLYRKITHGQFCSSAHRKAYWQEQERLAVERLAQTHNSLQAYRSPAPIGPFHGPGTRTLERPALEPEDWRDPVPETQSAALPSVGASPVPASPVPASSVDPVMAGYISEGPLTFGVRRRGMGPDLVVAGPIEYELEPHLAAEFAVQETGMPQTPAERLPFAGLAGLPLAPARNAHRGESPKPEPVDPRTQAVRPEWSFAARAELHTAEAVRLSLAQPTSLAQSTIWRTAATTSGADPLPSAANLIIDVAFEVQPETSVLERMLERRAPLQERLYALVPGGPRDWRRDARRTSPAGSLTDPLVAPPQPYLPLDGLSLVGLLPPASLLPAGLRPLPMRENPRVHGIWMDSLRAVDFSQAGGPVSDTLTTSPQAAQVRLARGNGYRIEAANHGTSAAPASGTAVTDLQIPPGDVALPSAAGPLSSATPRHTVWTPPSAAMVPLPMNASSARPPVNVPHASATAAMYSLPQPSRLGPMLPQSGLEPLAAKPVADLFQPAFPPPPMGSPADARESARPSANPFPPAAGPFAKSEPRGVPLWAPVADFWKHAPRDLRLLVFAIPALIALVFHPSSFPKVSLQAPKTPGIENVLNAQLASVRQTVVDRAAVALDEDFRSGLDGWTSRGNATAAWSFDATGFVQPGPLAVYQPSMGLSDYQLQFLGMIDKKALSWVVRAADFENYYVIKLVVLKPGPLPLIGLTRYAVINGKAVDRVDTAVPINARADMLYRVRVDIHGEDFSLEVQGQMIDSWSEPRLRRGGIGFFSARGEESRVRWVQVTHQYDMLGRLCAYLAPYNIPTGSW